ncbi:hypothetical protein LUZ63_019916 [Rhynchospora breviuscula]|uniref:Mitochondrial import inner membrane translocase subunit TIM50 n=1 Tax=Rhynchospora breviuscula TaxID=2022672 RepID=A0A9Q0HJH7_9POAL|nr:hypothetical protein LUZ63_019916 [Rhynchospora breviuscula]
MSELASASASASDAWSALLTWLSLLLRNLLHVIGLGGTYSYWAWVPSHLLFNFKPLPSQAESEAEAEAESEAESESERENLSVLTSTSRPPLPVSSTLHRLTVVLDLDETLVCAYDTSTLTQPISPSLNSFQFHFFSSTKQLHATPKLNHVTVFERPGLHHFLQELSKFAHLVLFTAALQGFNSSLFYLFLPLLRCVVPNYNFFSGYARPLVDRIDVHHRFKLRLYRPATVTTEYREHVKDLTCISNDLSRVVIVDNNPFSFLLQPLNGIPCVPFSPSQPSDDQLLSVLLPLLKELSIHRDVRPLLNCIFQMPDWFQKHGIPPPPPSS